MSEQAGAAPTGRGRVDKQQAIVRAARSAFGRDGYARSSIDAIAAAAGVSTRTMYNHFPGKEQLFAFVMRESATQVADTLTALMDQHLGDGSDLSDLEGALFALGRAWVDVEAQFADHFAMVRQIAAEAGHVPQAILDSWQEAGPIRVEDALARQMQRLAARNLLRADNARRTAHHFLLLTVGEVSSRSFGSLHGAIDLDDAELQEIVTAGVRAFLYGCGPAPHQQNRTEE
jgi:AcrR family transcriptional regulator